MGQDQHNVKANSISFHSISATLILLLIRLKAGCMAFQYRL